MVEDLGDIGTSNSGTGASDSFVTIAAGPTAVVVCVPPRAYTCGPGSGRAAQSDHRSGLSWREFHRRLRERLFRVLVARKYIAMVHFGAVDPSSYDALDFAFSDALPNVIRRVIGHRNQLWTSGEGGSRSGMTRVRRASENNAGHLVLSVSGHVGRRRADSVPRRRCPSVADQSVSGLASMAWCIAPAMATPRNASAPTRSRPLSDAHTRSRPARADTSVSWPLVLLSDDL